MQADRTAQPITDEMIERGAAALWKAYGNDDAAKWIDAQEREAAWANTCSDAEAVLLAALEAAPDA